MIASSYFRLFRHIASTPTDTRKSMSQFTTDADTLVEALEHITGLQAADNIGDVIAIFERSIQLLGASSFAAGIVENPAKYRGKPLVITNWPEDWQKRWEEKQYWNVDAVIWENIRKNQPFEWRDVFEKADTQGRMVFNEARTFGLYDGYSVPTLNDDRTVCTLSLSGEKLEWSDKDRALIHMISLFFIGTVRKFLRPEERKPDYTLTPREREVMHWTAVGKDISTIGEILSISNNGVKFHLKNIYEKMGVRSKAEAIVEAIRNRLIGV